MDGMISTHFFQCDRCHVECRIDSEATESSTAKLIIRHCPDSKSIAVQGKVTRFRNDGAVCGWMFSVGLTWLSGLRGPVPLRDKGAHGSRWPMPTSGAARRLTHIKIS